MENPHLMPHHGLQRGVLVLQRGGVWAGALGHHLLLIVIHRQSLRHLLYVLPQRGDGLPDEQQDYQPGKKQSLRGVRWGVGVTHRASSPNTQMPSWAARRSLGLVRPLELEPDSEKSSLCRGTRSP